MTTSAYLAILGIGGGIFVVLYTLLAQSEDKRVVRDSLRALDGFETVENVRDRDLLNPLRQRALLPFLNTLTRLGRRFTPIGYVAGVRRRFVLAGNNDPDIVDRFLAMRVATVAALPVTFWFFMILNPLGQKGMLHLMTFGLIGAILFLGPDVILNRRVAERQFKIRIGLPDVLDLLVISVEAGLGFEQALDKTIMAVPGPLTEEFMRMLGETRAGSARSDAMRAMETRIDIPEVKSFVLAIIQADTFGISIGRVLRSQAEELRVRRRQRAQELAQKAPVKMLIPMLFCIFPALFAVVIGPAIINISKNFS
jgi:tight adherence protein C